MKRKPFEPPWPELPRSRTEIDHVHELLCEWAKLAGLGDDEAGQLGKLFRNSVVHVLECALILWLAPYAYKSGFDSEIFADGNELAHALDYGFEHGFPLEMAQALSRCYALDEPWKLSAYESARYVDQLTDQLKNIAQKLKIEEQKQQINLFETKLENIQTGHKNRADAKDKSEMIVVVQKNNIRIKNIPELRLALNLVGLDISKYTNDTIKGWYREAMPEVKLKGGRPRKKAANGKK